MGVAEYTRTLFIDDCPHHLSATSANFKSNQMPATCGPSLSQHTSASLLPSYGTIYVRAAYVHLHVASCAEALHYLEPKHTGTAGVVHTCEIRLCALSILRRSLTVRASCAYLVGSGVNLPVTDMSMFVLPRAVTLCHHDDTWWTCLRADTAAAVYCAGSTNHPGAASVQCLVL